MPKKVLQLQPGDLFVLKGDKGYWDKVFTYEGIDAQDPDRILGRAIDSGNVYAVHVSRAERPKISQLAEVAPVAPAQHGDGPITPEQRRCIFGLGRSRGMDIDELRELTPTGSISALSRSEADSLIASLQGRKDADAKKARGSVTGKQIGMVLYLRDQIGFSEQEFGRWLHRQFGFDAMEKVYDGRIASRVIGGLIQVQKNRSTQRRVAGSR